MTTNISPSAGSPYHSMVRHHPIRDTIRGKSIGDAVALARLRVPALSRNLAALRS